MLFCTSLDLKKSDSEGEEPQVKVAIYLGSNIISINSAPLFWRVLSSRNVRVKSRLTTITLSKCGTCSPLLSWCPEGLHTRRWLTKSPKKLKSLRLPSPWGRTDAHFSSNSISVFVQYVAQIKFFFLIKCSLTAEGSDQSELSADTDMESVWSSATGGRITLWCKTKEVSLLCLFKYLQYLSAWVRLFLTTLYLVHTAVHK